MSAKKEPSRTDAAAGSRPRSLSHSHPAKRPHSIADLRASWEERLPRWMQPFLTWLSGYPHAGQNPVFANKPWWVVVLICSATLLSGFALSFLIATRGGFTWFGLPIAWLMVVFGARTFQVYVCHQGVHGILTGNPRADRMVVEAISTVLVVQNYDGYLADHREVHHPHLASDADVDRKFVVDVMRLQPSVSENELKARFLRSLISPRLHALFLVGRLRANFVSCPRYRRIMAASWAAILITALIVSQQWLAFVIGCVIPMTLIYQASAMCQFVTEHFWTRKRQPGQSAKDHYSSLLINRHLGDPLPACELRGLSSLFAWIIWWVRLCLYHLPIRLGILVGDLPVHGSHHLWPLEKRWTDHIFAFHELAEKSNASLIEFVGSYGQMLDCVLKSISEDAHSTDEMSQPPLSFLDAVKVANGM